MKKILLAFFFVSFTASAEQTHLYIRDEAKLLSPTVAEELEQKAIALEKATTIEFAVVTTPSLEETDIKDFSVRLFEKLGVGKKEKDNGVMLVVAPVERKAHIEVGYGLEGLLNDAKVTRLLRENFVPHIQKGNAEEAIRQSFIAAVSLLEGNELKEGEKESDSSGIMIFLAAVFLLFVLAIVFGKKRRGGGSSGSSSGSDDSGGSSSNDSSGGSGGSFGGGRSGGGGGSVGW